MGAIAARPVPGDRSGLPYASIWVVNGHELCKVKKWD